MPVSNKDNFLATWPKCFILFMAIVEVICVAGLFVTELCNVAANFWLTNVFAGGWCGIVILIHVILLFAAGCCAAGPKPAFYAAIVGFVGLIASAALISFDAVFIALPTTCLLTPSCATNAVSNTTFTYSFRQSFFTVFNSWGSFKTYGESQTKFLCQTVQLCVGGVCFIVCAVYIITYYVCASKAKQTVSPTAPRRRQQQQQEDYYGSQQQDYAPPVEQDYYPPAPQNMYPPMPQQQYYPPSAAAWNPRPQVNVVTVNANRRY